MKTFRELGLSEQVVKVLEQAGFKEPSEIQEKTIPLALQGKDIIGGSATGSGKTLAFASPIIENLKSNGNVQALILTPTRELAEQVTKSIRWFASNKKLEVLPIYGGIGIEPQIKKIRFADIVVGTPGRILDHLNRRTLNLSKIKILVLDEVDRMFDMGFQRDVEKIIQQCPKERQTMLFSATISSDIDYLSKKHTQNAEVVSVKSYIDHSKLKQIFYDVSDREKFSLLVHLLKHENSNLVMVFCSTRRNTDFVARNLNKIQIEAKAIHGGLSQNQRTRVLKEFHGNSVGVLVCTDIAARGLDIKNISHVYNYDLPKTSADYIHRIGRTARAGENGIAISILASRDYDNFRNILRDKSLTIERTETPKFETIEVKSSFSKPQRNNYSNQRHSSPRRNYSKTQNQRNNYHRTEHKPYRKNNSKYSRDNSSNSQEDSDYSKPRRYSGTNTRRISNFKRKPKTGFRGSGRNTRRNKR